MRIWFTEIGEPLPIERNVRLHRYGMLTKALASYGHEIVWWTSTFSHAPKEFFRNKDCQEIIDGVIVKFIHGLGYKKNISLRRIRHQKHFAERFYQKANFSERPDLIITPIPTIEVAEKAINFSIEHHIPILIDIRDKWPDEFVDLAPKKCRWLIKIILDNYFRKMHYVCQNASGILGVSESYLNYGLSFAKRSLSTNDGFFPFGYTEKFVDTEKISKVCKWWKQQGVDKSAFICCFFGTIGKFFNLKTVIDTAKILSKEFKIQFVLCGNGSSLSKYKKMAKNVESVIFPGWVDAPKIIALMSISDVGLAPYAANTKMSLPNKPFEYFAGGLPVVSSIRGELKQIIAENDCGKTYNADSVEELCNALRDLYYSEYKRRLMGLSAKMLLKNKYSIEHISNCLNKHLENVIKNYK